MSLLTELEFSKDDRRLQICRANGAPADTGIKQTVHPFSVISVPSCSTKSFLRSSFVHRNQSESKRKS